MNDMSPVIQPKSDQYNADDFLPGPRTFTISGVQIKGGQEQPVQISLEGTDKYFRPCKSMSRVLVAAWGADATAYIGRSLTLYTDPKVKWGGMEVGGIRISHMSHITGKLQLALTATKGQRKPHMVIPLTTQGGAEATQQQAPRKTAANWRAEIDALATPEAVFGWLADHEGMAKHDNRSVRDLYAYAEARGAKLSSDMTPVIADEDPFAIDETFPGDK